MKKSGYSRGMEAENSSKCCSDEGLMMEAYGVLRIFLQKGCSSQIAIEREESVLPGRLQSRVVELQKNDLIKVCLTPFNPMVNWFSLNETKCTLLILVIRKWRV